MTSFPEQLPHGELVEVLPDIFVVTGQIRIEVAETHEFSRNMTVVRDGNELTLVNSIRLDDAGLEMLETLGDVRHVVKLGSYHGRDDAYYIDRYGAKLWAPEGMTYTRGEATDRTLIDGEQGPCFDSTAFDFQTPKAPEAALHLNRHGGVLLTCDSFQNSLGPDEFYNEIAAESKMRLGFFKKAVIGPGWRKFAEPKASAFQRLLKLKFQHLLTGHGGPLLNEAYEAISASVADFRE